MVGFCKDGKLIRRTLPLVVPFRESIYHKFNVSHVIDNSTIKRKNQSTLLSEFDHPSENSVPIHSRFLQRNGHNQIPVAQMKCGEINSKQ